MGAVVTQIYPVRSSLNAFKAPSDILEDNKLELESGRWCWSFSRAEYGTTEYE
jgi:hypothetical protein